MTASPAEILCQYLIDEEIFTLPSEGEDWPLYMSFMPDSDNVENDCGAIYDTSGQQSATPRLITTGTLIFQYGIQLKVRSADYNAGYAKCLEVQDLLSSIYNVNITAKETDYVIDSINQSSTILSLGRDINSDKRNSLFTVNFLMMLRS